MRLALIILRARYLDFICLMALPPVVVVAASMADAIMKGPQP